MAGNRFCDQTAIAGIGWTEFTKNSGTTVLNLAAKASLMAIDDAGLSVRDIDGVVTFYWHPDTINPEQLIQALGIPVCHYEAYAQLGGNWCCGAVASAATAVHAGMCKNVLVYRAMNGRSENHAHRSTAGAAQFTTPYGVAHAAANFGHPATAHMARFGTTTLDFAHLAVTQRQHATLNQKAMMRTPMTLQQHQTSRPFIHPYRLLDCCLRTDGAVAVVVTSGERARDLRQSPVYIMAATGGGHARTDHPWETNAVRTAPQLFGSAGISPQDVSFAELYDPFSFMCMAHMEDFGLVPRGEVGGWVRAGENGLDGRVPVNTHGGLLSEGYIQGLNHVVEAVQQLRPGGVVDDLCQGAHSYDRTMCRQVRNPNIALVCGEGGDSSLLLRRA